MPRGVYARKPRAAGKRQRKVKASGGPVAALRMRRKIPALPTRVFTETLEVSDLLLNADGVTTQPGQVWNIAFNSIPQWKDYQALYTQFKILAMKFTYMPIYNSYEVNQSLVNQGSGGTYQTVPQFSFAIQDSTNCPAPVNQLDVLAQNDCRSVNFTKPIKVTCYKPQPETFIATSGSGNVGYDKKAWLDIDQANTVYHNGIRTYVQCHGLSGIVPGNVIGKVYCKVTFALRDTR